MHRTSIRKVTYSSVLSQRGEERREGENGGESGENLHMSLHTTCMKCARIVTQRHCFTEIA